MAEQFRAFGLRDHVQTKSEVFRVESQRRCPQSVCGELKVSGRW
jgi:hypothetical protein